MIKVSRKTALIISKFTLRIAEDERFANQYESLFYKGFYKGRAEGMEAVIKELVGKGNNRQPLKGGEDANGTG